MTSGLEGPSFDEELDRLLEGNPELVELARLLRASRPTTVLDSRFQRRKGNARVASSRVREPLEYFVGHDRTQFAKTSFIIFDCALENCFDFALRQWI